jgi:ABC-type dipeptide/oligopeptide/nickel transport system ATPase subunit
MKFRSIRVANLRAVRLVEANDLHDFIVIAGQNGSGKSCVFDALRLLKSVYGGSQDEHMQWFGEFEINLQDRGAMRRMFRDPAQPVEVSATLELSIEECHHIVENGADLVWPLAWERVTGQRIDHYSFNRMSIATQLEQWREPVEQMVKVILAELEVLKTSNVFDIALTIKPDASVVIVPCLPATVAFGVDDPEHLGVVEYHSASRSYTRQQVGGINLDARAFQAERRQQRLYNSQAKYQNVKTELASGYLRALIAAESGGEAEGEDLNETLKELFRTFFPDKEYLGVRPLPGGSLEFPVQLPEGGVHDIDDLSSGEKEILYGYLRLRNSTPRRSVILLDEPELHLNPSLLQGFTDFYYRHLGLAQENQLWLVTHSDTLLRQAIGNSNYRVYHMQTANSTADNQASPVLLDNDVERAVVDLVGDLAAYRPHAKVVILEGKSVDGFDEMLIRRLFPEFAKRVNLVSAESKKRVRDLYAALNLSAEQMGMPNRFFAIVDRDAEGFRSAPDDGGDSGTTETTWDVYHVENFLLEPTAIRAAVSSLAGMEKFKSSEEVIAALRTAAAAIVDRLVLEEIRSEVNNELVQAIDVGAPRTSTDIPADILPSIEGSVQRIIAQGEEYSHESLKGRVAALREELEGYLESDGWLNRFPGRAILRRFVGEHLSADYETFRNVVMDKMATSEYRPENMRSVLQAILDA